MNSSQGGDLTHFLGNLGKSEKLSEINLRIFKDYRSWRDVFIKKDAPDFILQPPDDKSPSASPESLHDVRFQKRNS